MEGYGVCNLSIVPGRKGASDSSEMTTQLLFGESYEVLELGEKFVRIKSSFDHYECWICKKQHQKITFEEFEKINNAPKNYVYDILSVLEQEEQIFPVVVGSFLPDIQAHKFSLAQRNYRYDGETCGEFIQKEKIVSDAYTFLNAPYLWGGKSPLGIDCSGFTQLVYKINGIAIPRDAYQQAEIGEGYSFVEECEAGDLAFFDNAEGKIVHVGIVLGAGKIIHASGKVRIDKLDHYGIFNNETGKYSHKLRLIKKII